MSNNFVVCDNCGTKCNVDDTFCKVCFQSLSGRAGNQIIDGIDNAELGDFIGKNADYYTEKFAKKKGKLFVQLNIPALLFGPTWFFYRKMKRIAAMYVAVLMLLSSFLSLVLPVVFQADVEEYFVAREAYTNYINSGGEVNLYKDPPYSTVPIGIHPTFQKLRDELVAAQNKIRLIEALIVVPVLVINIAVRLFANAIYKKHITENIHSNKGGVSMKSAIGGLVLSNLIMFVVSVLINLIPAVLEFSVATETLMFWI